MQAFAPIARFLERERNPWLLSACAVAIAAVYVLSTFDSSFVLGSGPFWANPRGPWLMDPNDSVDSVDVMTTRVGYEAFLHAPWGLPLFYVPNLGAPAGASVILVDAVPIVALLGKLLFCTTGLEINPYGIWIAACFVLSAVFAVLLVMQTGARSLLAAVAASVLAISMPTLLHRFGHLSLCGQFVVIGGLWLYLRDAQVRGWRRLAWWAGWLCLAALLHGYLFVMAAALYSAAWLRRLDTQRPGWQGAFGEPLGVGICVACVLFVAGHFGRGTGTSPSGEGFGYFSMNLLSPFWPQRSGLFPAFDALQVGPAGQYEGFNYLGGGVLTLTVVAIVLFWRVLPRALGRHLPLLIILGYLAVFAVSDAVFLGRHQLLYVPLPHPLAFLAGVFRSSGRMFWPCGYAVALLGLAFVLRHMAAGWKSVMVLGCCLLQLIDSNPLRTRLTRLTERDVPTLIDHAAWQTRMARAARVSVTPPFSCSGAYEDVLPYAVHLELQFVAMTTQRPIDSVYNPRLVEDCAAANAAALQGPWDAQTLYVFLTPGSAGVPKGIPPDWRPAGMDCTTFERGFWCLGTRSGT